MSLISDLGKKQNHVAFEVRLAYLRLDPKKNEVTEHARKFRRFSLTEARRLLFEQWAKLGQDRYVQEVLSVDLLKISI